VARAGVVVDISVMSLRQAATPNHLLGRVTTISRTIGFVAIPLNTLLGGALIDGLGNVVLIDGVIGALTLVRTRLSATAPSYSARSSSLRLSVHACSSTPLTRAWPSKLI